MVIGIIGAGASGMAAAICAARDPKNEILLFERQSRVGRKLLATGNGRCNLSNLHADVSHYHGDQPDFAATALSVFDVKTTLSWFSSLGLYTVSEDSGRVYPYSDSANSVVDVLRFALDKPNIHVYYGVEIASVEKHGEKFILIGSEKYECDRLIIACGGVAGSKLGGSMSGYKLLRSMHHHCTRLRPNLVQIKSSWHGIAALKGVRANCKASIYKKDTLFAESVGEVQFTEYGISGPVIFEVSRDVCEGPGPWVCRLDFLPDLSYDTLFSMLKSRKASPLTCEDLLTGILHNRLGRVLVQAASLRGQIPIAELTDDQIRDVCKQVKGFSVILSEPMGMDNAQVTAGGIVTSEFDPATMESLLVPGLYACGEVLDIDGDCGGFNLQWAWSSGTLAGMKAGGISL